MKKSRKQSKTGRRRAKATMQSKMSPADDEAPGVSRRGFLVKARNYGLAVAVAGGAGWLLAADFRDALAEEDLSKIGAGVPTVVQIHDPQCPRCRALQKEARAAMEEFADGEIRYLVANIRQPRGRDFAAQQGVGHVTLLIFDENGRRQEVLSGPNSRARLKRVFARHAAKPAPKPPAPKVAPTQGETGPPTS